MGVRPSKKQLEKFVFPSTCLVPNFQECLLLSVPTRWGLKTKRTSDESAVRNSGLAGSRFLSSGQPPQKRFCNDRLDVLSKAIQGLKDFGRTTFGTWEGQGSSCNSLICNKCFR